MQASSSRIQQRGQGINVSGFEFRKLAELQHLAGNGVRLCKAFEHVYRGGDHLALAVLHRLRQIHFVEEYVPELLGRIDVELASSALVYFAGLGFNFALQARRHFFRARRDQSYPRLFHARKDWNQRQIDFFVQLQKLALFDFLAQGRGESSGHVGRFRQRAA